MLNLVSIGAAFGVMTLVFQHGWGSGLLDFTSPGFVIDWLPLFVLVVLVGLSMDYHVFVLSRIREHMNDGLPTRLAVERGIADTAGVVTSAAAVMVSVFAIFATLSMMEMKMMGVGLAAAILLDATLIRLVMLPAILVLLGDKVWWPTRQPRRWASRWSRASRRTLRSATVRFVTARTSHGVWVRRASFGACNQVVRGRRRRKSRSGARDDASARCRPTAATAR